MNKDSNSFNKQILDMKNINNSMTNKTTKSVHNIYLLFCTNTYSSIQAIFINLL